MGDHCSCSQYADAVAHAPSSGPSSVLRPLDLASDPDARVPVSPDLPPTPLMRDGLMMDHVMDFLMDL